MGISELISGYSEKTDSHYYSIDNWEPDSGVIVDIGEVIHYLREDPALNKAAIYLGEKAFIEFFSTYTLTISDPWCHKFMEARLVDELKYIGVSQDDFVNRVIELNRLMKDTIKRNVSNQTFKSLEFAGFEIMDWLDGQTVLIESNNGRWKKPR